MSPLLLRFVVVVGVVGVAYHYLSLVTLGSLDVFAPAYLGLTFNSMALHLLEGRFDVDPQAIGIEAFVRGDRTYAYFGIFPALLRLPLVPFLDLTVVHVERLSCLLAMLVGAGGQVAATLSALSRARGPARIAMMMPLLLAACFSGPAVMLGRNASIYDEAVLWGWALAMVFVALALSGLMNPKGFGTLRLAAMAVFAGLCLLTRATMGIGLFAGVTLLLVGLMVERGRPMRRIIVPAAVLALFAALAGGVNAARWGTPFSFADFHIMKFLLAKYPERLPRLETLGMFNIARLPIGILYYFVPIWIWQTDGHYFMQNMVVRMTDGFELPPSSFFVSDPLTVFLAVAGCVAVVRARPAPASIAAPALLLIGMAVAPALMLIAWGMTFRYRAEFYPLLVLAALLAGARWAQRLNSAGMRQVRNATAAIVALCLLQLVSAQMHSIVVALSPFDPVEVAAPDGIWRAYMDRWRAGTAALAKSPDPQQPGRGEGTPP